MNLKKTLLSLALFSTVLSVKAATFTGSLSGVQEQMIFDEQYSLSIPKDFLYTMDKVYLGWDNYYFQVEGELIDNQIVADQTPTIVAGKKSISGVLEKVGNQYQMNGNVITFGRTKSAYDYNDFKFDQLSKDSFVGKSIRAYGNMTREGFEVNSILLKGLFSADEGQYVSTQKFKKDPLKYILKEMPKNINSQKRTPFRGIVVGNDYSPVEGDPVLIITLSGRQGDAANTVGGHFAIGMGELDKQLEVQGEIFNFYFEGAKEVPAGNTELSSYFGHLIQGQNNYRPTYTVLVYGKTKEELKSVRDAMEFDLHRVRTEEGLGITPMYNCSTSAFKTLAPIGIRGSHEYTKILGRLKKPARDLNYSSKKSLQLFHGFVQPRATYIPRVTFESLIKNVVKRGESMGIKRMDYIFLPQTMSRRPVGGMSVNGLLKTLKFYSVDSKRVKAVKKYLKALETINDENAGRYSKWKATRVINKYKNDEEFQKVVTELMSKSFENG